MVNNTSPILPPALIRLKRHAKLKINLSFSRSTLMSETVDIAILPQIKSPRWSRIVIPQNDKNGFYYNASSQACFSPTVVAKTA
jgi:hypothetical protein